MSDDLGAVLQILGFLVSIVALGVSWRAFRRSGRLTDLQTRIATLELAAKKKAAVFESKADVRATIYSPGRLVIENRGGGTATNVDLTFQNPEHEQIFPQGVREENLPIAELGSQDSVSILVALVMGRYPPFDCTLTWTDPDGSEQEKAGKLRLSE